MSQAQVQQNDAPPIQYELTCSQFSEAFFELAGKPFSVNEKFSYLRKPMDDTAPMQLYIFGRQSGKSTIMSGKSLAIMSLMPYTSALHVSPTETNRKQFERDRLKAFMKSKLWRQHYYADGDSDNTEYKQLNNGSFIYLRNVFENADRVRGISAGYIQFDEVQDIIRENMEIVFECQSVPEFKMTIMAGTQSSLESSINYYWELSDQKEFVMFCTHCSKWNEIDEKNIGKEGVICRKCGGGMNSLTDPWDWGAQSPGAHISAYRFPQICRPGLDWENFYQKFLTNGQQWLFNEILALPYDSAGKPITRKELIDACIGGKEFTDPYSVGGMRTFAGIDWGTGSPSTTQLVILRELIGGKCELIYAHKYVNYESDPQIQREEIIKRIKEYNVTLTLADWGGQYEQNKLLAEALSVQRFQQVYLSGNQKEIAKFEPTKFRWTVSREQMLTNMFLAIKKGNLTFPSWDLIQPFGEEILNIFTKYNETRRLIVYDHRPDKPDDFAHSVNFAYMAFNFALGRITPAVQQYQGRPGHSY